MCYKNKLRKFFVNEFPRLLLVTGKNKNNYTSVKLKSGKNRMDYYNNVLYCLTKAINSLTDTSKHPYRTIIIEKYINVVRTKDIEKIIGYGHNYTAKLLNQSLKELERAIKAEQLKYNILPLLEFNND